MASSSSTSAAAPSSTEQHVSHAWEATAGGQLWENAVREDKDGNIIVDEGDTLAQAIRKRRKRLEQNDYSQRNRRVVRDMIRYVYILIDASRWMRTKDPVLPPGTRIDVTILMLQDFVQEFYDQNPLSHLGFVLLKNGEAEILTQLSSSSKTHKLALESLGQMAASEPPTSGGEFSLQNGLEVAGRSLGHQPRHGSREIVILTAALSTCDPGYLLTDTLPKLQLAKIRVSCFALSAEIHICRKLAEETKGAMGVCLDKPHFRDWLMGQCVPPPAHRDRLDFKCEMVQMGFPTRTSADVPSIVHMSREKTALARTAYTCPQCQARNSELPADCAVCGLKLGKILMFEQEYMSDSMSCRIGSPMLTLCMNSAAHQSWRPIWPEAFIISFQYLPLSKYLLIAPNACHQTCRHRMQSKENRLIPTCLSRPKTTSWPVMRACAYLA